MRQAPPVAGITVSNAGAWRGIHAALAALSSAVLAAWMLEVVMADPARPWLVTCATSIAAALVAGAAMARGRRERPAELRWDGQTWHVDDEPMDVDVMLDLGRWLLLRCRSASATRWLAVPQAQAGVAWGALRAALYAPAAPKT